MSQRIIQICDRCKTEINTTPAKYGPQNYQICHEVKISVFNAYKESRRAVNRFDLCPVCEDLLFEFLNNGKMLKKS